MEWKKYVLKTTTFATDLVCGVLMENGISSFEIEDKRQISEADKEAMFIDIIPELCDDGIANIIFYLDMDITKDEENRVLDSILSGVKELSDFVDVGNVTIEKSTTKDVDWINKWKEFFKPFTVDDILIRPTWEKVENEADYKMVIKIDPGTAFGTGLHETTQLCIRQLRKYITGETALLDVGCGSGILSIIGRKLGAKSAFGTDIDEAAIIASVENAKENEVNSDIEFIVGNIIDDKSTKESAGYEKYDIVVANILADVIIPLSKIIKDHIKIGGLFITSGIIEMKEAEVVAAIEENPAFKIVEITRQKEWVSVTAERVK